MISKATTLPIAFFIFLLMFMFQEDCSFFSTGIHHLIVCVKSPWILAKVLLFRIRSYKPTAEHGVFKHSLERKTSFLRKEGRFYLVSSLSKHFAWKVCLKQPCTEGARRINILTSLVFFLLSLARQGSHWLIADRKPEVVAALLMLSIQICLHVFFNFGFLRVYA